MSGFRRRAGRGGRKEVRRAVSFRFGSGFAVQDADHCTTNDVNKTSRIFCGGRLGANGWLMAA